VFLGFIVNKNRVHVDPKKIKVIQEWPTPFIPFYPLTPSQVLYDQLRLKLKIKTEKSLALPEQKVVFIESSNKNVEHVRIYGLKREVEVNCLKGVFENIFS